MGKDYKLVSIVVPAYNYAHYLEETIQSVLNQDYANIELIVLDDGSTDNTREVLERYTGRFYWETQKNMGHANTVNKGWQMSKGKVLGYLNADDILLPNAVSTSVRKLQENPDVVMTYCDYNLIDENSRVVRRINASVAEYRDMIVKVICPPGPGALFLREPFEAAGLWDPSLRLIQDYDYWLRLGLQGKFLKIPEVLAAFRAHGGSVSFAEADEMKSEEYVRVISGYYKTQKVPDEVLAAKNEALSNAYIFAASSHFRSGRYFKGFKRLLRGLVAYPRNLSLRTARLTAHGLFHVRQGFLQRVMKVFERAPAKPIR